MFTTSPATLSPTCGPAPKATTASPLSIPIRTASGWAGRAEPASSAIVSWILIAASTARIGSSSWATGAPNTPSTASPMNLSIVPP